MKRFEKYKTEITKQKEIIDQLKFENSALKLENKHLLDKKMDSKKQIMELQSKLDTANKKGFVLFKEHQKCRKIQDLYQSLTTSLFENDLIPCK